MSLQVWKDYFTLAALSNEYMVKDKLIYDRQMIERFIKYLNIVFDNHVTFQHIGSGDTFIEVEIGQFKLEFHITETEGVLQVVVHFGWDKPSFVLAYRLPCSFVDIVLTIKQNLRSGGIHI